MKKPKGSEVNRYTDLDSSLASIGSSSSHLTDRLFSGVDLSKIPRSQSPIDTTAILNSVKKASQEKRAVETFVSVRDRLSAECQKILEPLNRSVHERLEFPELALVGEAHTALIATLHDGVTELKPTVRKLFDVKQELPVTYELMDFFNVQAALCLCHHFQLFESKSVDWLGLLNDEGGITIYQFDGEIPGPARHLYLWNPRIKQPKPIGENASMLCLEEDLITGNENFVSPITIIEELAAGDPLGNIRNRMLRLVDVLEDVPPDTEGSIID